MFSLLDCLYRRKIFSGLGNLTELEAIEIQPIEFEKVEKIPVFGETVP